MELNQVGVLNLRGQLKLDAEVVFALLQVVDERPVLLYQVELVGEQTGDEAKDKYV